MTRYAVGCADLMCHPERKMLAVLLAPALTREAVSVDAGAIDGVAILVREDTPPEQWAAIVRIIREVKGIDRNRLRIFESRTGSGSWKRI